MQPPLTQNYSHLLAFHFRQSVRFIGVAILALCYCFEQAKLRADEVDSFAVLDNQFQTKVQPLLRTFCINCHSSEKLAGELNLQRFASIVDVRKDPRIWQKIVFMLDNQEMPPKDSQQLSALQLMTLRSWIAHYLDVEAHANAGDPGRVVLRRLSNVEYNNTIRDLTNIDFKPTQQFPADSVAGEGFTNTGESLVMSPALLDKYMAAARDLAAHAVLLPDGFRFSKTTTEPDWVEEVLTEIRAIHEKHTVLYEDRDRDNVTRIQWGHVDIQPYLSALIKYRQQLLKDDKAASTIASQTNLNPIYLQRLTTLLDETPLTPLLAKVQSRLRQATLEDADDIVHDIQTWQNQLFELKNVGEMFNQGQVPLDPLSTRQTFRLQMKPAPSDEFVTLTFTASDAGDNSVEDRVIWSNPRFEALGAPPILLRDMRAYISRLGLFRQETLAQTAKYLSAAVQTSLGEADVVDLAKRANLDLAILESWMKYLNVQPRTDQHTKFAPQPGRILLMVVNAQDPKIGDAGIAQFLRARGHEVTFYNPAGKTAEQQHQEALHHDLVIISESIAAADVIFTGERSLKDLPRPIISFEPYMFDDAAWTNQNVWGDFGHTGITAVQPIGLGEPSTSLFVSAIEHPMTLGLRGKTRIYNEPYTFTFGVPATTATIIATVDEQGRYPATFVYDAGDTLVDGSKAPAARIALFLGQAAQNQPAADTPTNMGNVSFVGHMLMNAAVEYAVNPQQVSRPHSRMLTDNDQYLNLFQQPQIPGLLVKTLSAVKGHPFVNGWGGGPEDPLFLANSSASDVRIPGHVRARSIMVHPTTTHFVAAGWRSPINSLVRIEISVVDAHPEGGNGIAWSLDHHQGASRQRLASANLDPGRRTTATIHDLMVGKGDVVSLAIDSRGADWACDSTRINVVITEQSDPLRSWNLASDVNQDIQAGNPHQDRYGNPATWLFFAAETGSLEPTGVVLPIHSSLALWRSAAMRGRDKPAALLAQNITRLLVDGPSESSSLADKQLYRYLRASTSPLFRQFDFHALMTRNDFSLDQLPGTQFGLDPTRFKPDPADPNSEATSLFATAPSVLEIKLPADIVAGREFVVDAQIAPDAEDGTVQLQVATTTSTPSEGLSMTLPVLVHPSGVGKKRMETTFSDFRNLFPKMMCCRTVVPLDAVVTVVLFHREDEHLSQLLLNAKDRKRLDRLWNELHYISQDAIKTHDSFPLILEFASQVGEVPKLAPLEDPIRERAEAFSQYRQATEPVHLDQLIQFAQRAYRRLLTSEEDAELRALYADLRTAQQSHESAIRGVLASIFVAPMFLYRLEKPLAGEEAAPISASELATRLSYFLWSSMPDQELRAAAHSGEILEPSVLSHHALRMRKDPRIRGLATEFACQWLGIRNFDEHDEKNEQEYPSFVQLRGDMYEESLRFFEDLFQQDGSVLDILDANHTFLNSQLAAHYGLMEIEQDQWQRVEGIKNHSRGGVLGMATILSKQAGATRTSPILRGNWIAETLLGEKLPDPPATVPDLPDVINRDGLTVRQLTEKHVSLAQCAHCHIRIDPLGFALESFDAIGRFREKDLVGQPVDTHARLRNGTEFSGIDGLRSYLLTERKDDFLRQFCRKLLGFSLGRAVELSDEPLISKMLTELEKNNYRVSVALEIIIHSQQFRNHRGLAATQPSSI
ncbi:MAG: DUF1592 domain-containing protein [Pirellulaceae bacterium]|nr:DUF1592 domain-containing protein [Pirellulaceae bacterium]